MHRRSCYFNNNQQYQISFAEGFNHQSSNAYTEDVSSFIQCETAIQSVPKEKTRIESPIHNLHYKYLPAKYRQAHISQFRNQQSSEEENPNYIEKGQMSRGNINHINKKIDFILHEMGTPQQNECSQTFEGQQAKLPYLNGHKISKFSEAFPESYQNTINEILRTPSHKQKKYDYSSSFKRLHSYSNMSEIEQENKFRSPTVQVKIQKKKDDEVNPRQHSANSKMLGTSIYSNFSSKSHKSGRDVIVKSKSIDKQIDKLRCKEEALKQLKRTMNIDLQIPMKTSIHQEHIVKGERQPLKEINTNKIMIPKEPIKSQNQPLKQTSRTNMTHNQMLNSRSNSHLSSRHSNMKSSTTQQDHHNDLCAFNTFNNYIAPTQSCMISERHQFKPNQNISTPKILKKLNQKKKKKLENNIPVYTSIFQGTESQKQNVGVGLTTKQKPNFIPVAPSFAQYDFKIKAGSIVKNGSNYNSKQSLLGQKGAVQNDYKIFLHHFSEQVSLDESFRKIKQWFHRLKEESKWNQLLQQFSKNNPFMDQLNGSRIKTVFTMAPEEQNSFYRPQAKDYSYSQLVQAYIEAEMNWRKSILHNYEFIKHHETNFREENVDLRRRGYISPEDLLRFFNAELDTFYRNKDIYLIYQRFKIKDRLYFADVTRCLLKQ